MATSTVADGSNLLMWLKPASNPLYSATLFVAIPITSNNSATILPFSVTTAP